jgi:transcription antitermination factor NusG
MGLQSCLHEPAAHYTRRSPLWFAVRTAPRHEKRVRQYLCAKAIEYFLPVYRCPRKWKDGSRVTIELPLFPSYIFVHVDRSDRLRVLEIPGVVAFVCGAGREPASLSYSEMGALRAGLHLRQPEPHPLLLVGQKVRIRSGALAGMAGVVVRKRNCFRVVLTVDLIMQSVAVVVDQEELEPMDVNAVPSFHN